MPKALLILASILLAACGTNFGGKDFTEPAPAVANASSQPALAQAPPPRPQPSRGGKAMDPPVIVRPSVGLSVMQFHLPLGTISRSEAFWKRIEERAIDVATYDILQKNGFRVGLGAMAELESLLRPLDRTQIHPESASFVAANVKTIDLPMKQSAPEQTIYDFDLKDHLTVRTYEDADDIFLLEFQPAPRKAGDVRISVLPLIRTLRKRLVPISETETKEFEYRPDEKFFHLNLRLDLPLDSFLIVAPSPEGHAAMSLGHTFLINQGETQKYETILLITPQITKPPAPKSATPAGQKTASK